MDNRERFCVLLLEDSPADVFLCRTALSFISYAEFEIFHAERLSMALDILRAESIDLVLTDLNLPDSTGGDTFRRLLREAGAVPIVVLMGCDDPDLISQLMREGASAHLCKDHMNTAAFSDVIYEVLQRKHAFRP